MRSASLKPTTSPSLHVAKSNTILRSAFAPIQATTSRRDGSILVLVIIFTGVLSLTAASLLKFGTNERRLNKTSVLFTEARNGAESMVEYGFAELKTRWLRQTSFADNELRRNPLVIPDTASSFFAGGKLRHADFELVGGTVPDGEWDYIDPQDPANSNDPQKGKLVFSRDVKVFGKAVAEDPVLGVKTAYCEQVLSVRDAPLFSHAIFYNMDLEFHPGPPMDMQGPVHSNGDTYVQAVNRLRFHSTLMSVGDLIYGFKTTDRITQTGTVEVKDADGDWTSFYDGSGNRRSRSNYFHSFMDDWRIEATERWGGNVGSSEHSVPTLNPIGIDDYVPDDPDTSNDETENHAYALIEPVVDTDHANYKGDEVRDQQFAFKAGLVFRVTPTGSDYDVRAFKYDREDSSNPKSPPRMDADGNPIMEEIDLSGIETVTGDPLFTVNTYAEDEDGDPVGGFYDRRQTQSLDVIEMDVGVLAEAINDVETPGGSDDPWGGQLGLSPGSSVDWNGAVYVEMPYDDSASTEADQVMPANRNVALRLNNGQDVPNPDFASGSGFDPGFTLATNGQLYVKGHFNADGDDRTGSSTETDDGNTYGSDEAPVALLADSITILSDAFDDSLTRGPRHRRDAEFTEVSAALVTGLVPGYVGTRQQSGGAHNLPRFLEDWGGVEFRYRGSLVALYESEVATAPMSSNHSQWYSPPRRNWGFNDLFGAGLYPPGTPNTRDFRRTDFRFITAEEYDSELASLSGFDGSPEARGHDDSICNSDS